MADNKLEITLTLVDKASKDVKKAMSDIKGETDKIKKSGDAAGNSLQENLKKAGKEARDFRTALLPILSMVGFIILTTKTWALENRATKDAYTQLGDSIKTISSQIGSLFAPSIVGLSQAIKESTTSLEVFFNKAREGYKKTAEAITFASQYWVAFFTSVGAGTDIATASADALDIAADAADAMGAQFGDAFASNIPVLDESLRKIKENTEEIKNLSTQFIGGKISAVEYYEAMIEAQDSTISRNQLIADDLRNLATLESHLRDIELAETRNMIHEQIGLLQFYRQEQIIAQQGMATLAVQVGRTMQTSLSGAITDIVTETVEAREAFKAFGKAMIRTIVDFISQKIVAAAIEKTLLGASVGAGVAAGTALTAAYAPAALAANIASFGGAAAAAASTFPVAATSLSSSMVAVAAIPRAFGGDDIVSRPTMFLAGEGNRPERVTVSPVGGQDYHGGGFTINIYNPNLSTSQAVEDTAEVLGEKIELAVRRARSF